jgi:type I restriction enzyme R subunit
MITEDQLEQLAIQWFQDTGWTYANGADLVPEGRRRSGRIFGRSF